MEKNKQLVIKKTFSYPRELVFEAWIKPEYMKNWFCPNPDVSIDINKMDFREGVNINSFFIGHSKPILSREPMNLYILLKNLYSPEYGGNPIQTPVQKLRLS